MVKLEKNIPNAIHLCLRSTKKNIFKKNRRLTPDEVLKQTFELTISQNLCFKVHLNRLSIQLL